MRDMEISLQDFEAKVGKEDIFKSTIANKKLHEYSNGNEAGIVKCP
jgi:hypothetical protein